MVKYWEADIQGDIIVAPTLKQLAQKLGIRPSMIEGVYYRSRLEHKIKIRRIIIKNPDLQVHKVEENKHGFYEISFD